jgi:hypothetical protein
LGHDESGTLELAATGEGHASSALLVVIAAAGVAIEIAWLYVAGSWMLDQLF